MLVNICDSFNYVLRGGYKWHDMCSSPRPLRHVIGERWMQTMYSMQYTLSLSVRGGITSLQRSRHYHLLDGIMPHCTWSGTQSQGWWERAIKGTAVTDTAHERPLSTRTGMECRDESDAGCARSRIRIKSLKPQQHAFLHYRLRCTDLCSWLSFESLNLLLAFSKYKKLSTLQLILKMKWVINPFNIVFENNLIY